MKGKQGNIIADSMKVEDGVEIDIKELARTELNEQNILKGVGICDKYLNDKLEKALNTYLNIYDPDIIPSSGAVNAVRRAPAIMPN